MENKNYKYRVILTAIKKMDNTSLNDAVSKIVKPIFDKSLSEIKKNHMMVGKVGSKKEFISYYNPHNYRLYIDFSLSLDAKLIIYKDHSQKYGFKFKNSTELLIDNFHGCQIRIKKNQAEILNKKIREHIIYWENPENQIRAIVDQKDQECIRALQEFIKSFGGKSNFKILNKHSENKISNELMINRIKKNLTWHNPITKKVYKEHNVEFSNPILASNYLENRAIEIIAPQIAQSMDSMRKELKRINDSLPQIPTPEPKIIKCLRRSESWFLWDKPKWRAKT